MNQIKRMALVALAGLGPAILAWGEVPKLRESDLKKAAEIVVGKVTKIYQRDPVGSGFRNVQFVAELEVTSLEKGHAGKVGDVIYVHYWNNLGTPPQRWVGTRGHDSECIKEDAMIRVYLKQDKQGRREILLPNGAEALDD